MSEIQVVSELTGSGKTGRTLDVIAKSTDRWIIAVPNKSLCKEIFARLTERDVLDGIRIINSDTDDAPTTLLSNVLRNPKNTNIIITTHASYDIALGEGTTNIIRDKWKLVIDEELSFYKTHEFNVSEVTQDLLLKTINVREYDSIFYEVIPKSKVLWNDIEVDDCHDTFLTHPYYKDFVRHANSNMYTTLIPKENYDAFLKADADLLKRKFKKLYTISICNQNFFDVFKSTTILSSFFEFSIGYKLLQYMNVNMKHIKYDGMSTIHPNSDVVTINYYTNSNWTNVLKNKKINKSNETLENHIKDVIQLQLQGKDFIYNTNVKFRKKFSKGVLVTSIHGVNKYVDYTNMVFMSSLNATASLVNLLSHFGITRNEIDFSRTVLNAYQFISRGAIRKGNNRESVNIHVMDKRTANFLKILYPNANLVYQNAERMIEDTKKSKTIVPNNVRSFMSRVKHRLDNGDNLRQSTLDKYKTYKKLYYDNS